jgi:hypothetical protein
LKHYICKTDVRRGDPDKGEPKIVVEETILTRDGDPKMLQRRVSRWRALGIENIHVEGMSNKRYKAIMKEMADRRKPVKKLTVADIVESLDEDDKNFLYAERKESEDTKENV